MGDEIVLMMLLLLS